MIKLSLPNGSSWDLDGGGYIIGTNFVEEGFNIFTQEKPDFNKIFK